jgi:hypothetical protein
MMSNEVGGKLGRVADAYEWKLAGIWDLKVCVLFCGDRFVNSSVESIIGRLEDIVGSRKNVCRLYSVRVRRSVDTYLHLFLDLLCIRSVPT